MTSPPMPDLLVRFVEPWIRHGRKIERVVVLVGGDDEAAGIAGLLPYWTSETLPKGGAHEVASFLWKLVSDFASTLPRTAEAPSYEITIHYRTPRTLLERIRQRWFSSVVGEPHFAFFGGTIA